MPTEAELRDLLHDDGSEPGALDTADIIRRAKVRRRPKQLAAGIVGGVAAAGALAFVVPVALGLGGAGLSAAGGSAADQSGAGDDASTLKEYDAPESATSLPSAAALNLCGGTLSTLPPDPDGLELTVTPAGSAASGGWIEATVSLTNTGDEPFTGTVVGGAVVTLSGDGTVLWHSNGPTADIEAVVDLDPGESVSYPAGFEAVVCSPEDDASSTGFRSGLPAVVTGPYELSAAIDVVPDGAPGRVVGGPPTPVALH
jgi:hypothetical protein